MARTSHGSRSISRRISRRRSGSLSWALTVAFLLLWIMTRAALRCRKDLVSSTRNEPSSHIANSLQPS
jgi:hypothetical protein